MPKSESRQLVLVVIKKSDCVIFAVIPVYAQQSKCLLSIGISIYPSTSPLPLMVSLGFLLAFPSLPSISICCDSVFVKPKCFEFSWDAECLVWLYIWSTIIYGLHEKRRFWRLSNLKSSSLRVSRHFENRTISLLCECEKMIFRWKKNHCSRKKKNKQSWPDRPIRLLA